MEQKLLRSFGRNKSDRFPSLINNKAMKPESNLEMSFMYYLEFDDNVEKYQAQPVSITSDKVKRYTPDFLVKYKNGKFKFIEIKPKKFALEPSFIEKHGIRNDLILSHFGIPLTVCTDTDFLDPILNENYRRFYRYRNYDFSRYCLKTVKEYLTPCRTVEDVYEVAARLNTTEAFTPALFATKKVIVDFTRPFDIHNTVEVNINA